MRLSKRYFACASVLSREFDGNVARVRFSRGIEQGVADEHGLIGTIAVYVDRVIPGCLTGRHADVRVGRKAVLP